MPATMSLWERQNDIGSVPNTFSSWDNCMSKDYCKWPAIVGIIIASLIVLSLLLCLFRCLCCGAECCCACFSCFNACCPSPRRRSPREPKYADPPSHYQPPPYQNYHQLQPSPYQGYQPNPAPPQAFNPGPQPQNYNAPPPQFAQFDTSRKSAIANDDALPPMPSWDTAPSHKILADPKNSDVELTRLDPVHEQTAPMLAHQAPTPYNNYPPPLHSPTSPTLPYQQQYGRSAYAGGVPSSPVYSSYAPSGSTRFEPAESFGGQESGTVWHERLPPVVAQGVGRKPVMNSWREV